MSSAINFYGVLHYNPFILAPIFSTFFKDLPSIPKNILLSYIVLPLVLQKSSKQYLLNSKSTSSLRKLTEERQRIYGFASRIGKYKPITNLSLQYAIDAGAIAVGNNLSISVLEKYLPEANCPADTVRAAAKLSKLISPYDIPTVYRMLGIKRI